MGTVSIANALAFAPNFQKGLTAAGKVFDLLNRVPKIRDSYNASENLWVNIIVIVSGQINQRK